MDNNYLNNKQQILELKIQEKIQNMSESEIKETARKYKKRMLICEIIFSILFIPSIITIIIFACFNQNSEATISYIMIIIICSVVYLFFSYVVLSNYKKSDREVAYLEIKREMYPKIMYKNYDDNNQVSSTEERNFTKRIPLLVSSFSSSELLIDTFNKVFAIRIGRKYSPSFKFSDIINYEIYENGASKVKGTAGKALVGGVFFGLGGMIVGSCFGKKIKETCNQLKLIIRLKDIDNPQLDLVYVDNVNWDKNGLAYRNMIKNLQQVSSMLEYMMNNCTEIKEDKISDINMSQIEHENTKTIKEELQELKGLLDDGLISKEDYEAKKKQILGL